MVVRPNESWNLGLLAAVNAASARLACRTRSRRWVAVAGALWCGAAPVILIWQRAHVHPAEIWGLVVMAALAVGIEAAYRALTGRTLARTFHARR